MDPWRYIGIIFLAVILCGNAPTWAKNLSCEECREFDRERSRIAIELAKKEQEIERAFKKKEFKKVSEMREEINELRRKHLTLKGKEPECKIACRPDMVKEAECNKIIEELAGLDKTEGESASAVDTGKIDQRYKDLGVCNRELKKLRELHKN